MMFCRGLSKEGVHLYTTRTKRHRGTYTGSDCQDHYQLLGVGRKATTEEIKNAFFTKSKKLHPDSDPTNPLLHSQFVRLSEAYKVLSRETSRREYDLLLDALQREHWTPGVQSFYHSQYRPPPSAASEDNARYWAQFSAKRGDTSKYRKGRNSRLVLYCFLIMTGSLMMHYAGFRDVFLGPFPRSQSHLLTIAILPYI
ncbi:hypothetical protein GDO86_008593 [Hymenochirus boettgeri]|uniref:J domain-containing protein n=1 Tax=Hymenochirus boettgeri TaxID=247094 RepID=A0A8T2J121_9PIPI|nr:hypothetical protein GDO86_008593 [Hymenochirus boettgeri]